MFRGKHSLSLPLSHWGKIVISPKFKMERNSTLSYMVAHTIRSLVLSLSLSLTLALNLSNLESFSGKPSNSNWMFQIRLFCKMHTNNYNCIMNSIYGLGPSLHSRIYRLPITNLFSRYAPAPPPSTLSDLCSADIKIKFAVLFNIQTFCD